MEPLKNALHRRFHQKKLKTSFLVDFFNILSDWGLFWGQNIRKNFSKTLKACKNVVRIQWNHLKVPGS